MNKVPISTIDDILPQSQCQQCHYPSCYDYAKAIAEKHEAINKCAYGGRQVTFQLAELLNIPVITPIKENIDNRVALIDEQNCIGCMKCIHACPMNAIIGAKRQLHTVITDYCTGCNLCIAPCPTDCITLIAVEKLVITPAQARQRFIDKKSRQNEKQHPAPAVTVATSDPRKRAVAEAIARARAKKAQQTEFKIDLTLYKK